MTVKRSASALTSVVSGAAGALLPTIVQAVHPTITITTHDKWESAVFGAILGALVEGLHVTATVRRDRSDPGRRYER